MPEPLSPRTVARLEHAMAPIAAMLFEFCERLQDRKTLLPPDIRKQAQGMLGAARRVLSRDPASAGVPMLKGTGPIAPGELFIALLQAASALSAYAGRHGVRL